MSYLILLLNEIIILLYAYHSVTKNKYLNILFNKLSCACSKNQTWFNQHQSTERFEDRSMYKDEQIMAASRQSY